MGVRVSALTVRELNQRVQEILSASFGPELWVVGELHGVKHHAKSGHVYFDLVEKAEEQAEGYIARISCAFFRGAFVRWQTDLKRQGLTGFDLKDGLEVKLRARLDLFVKEGRYQLVVQGIDPGYSLGAMAQRRARTIAFLRQAHLMERNKALPLPVIPLEIGLITSAGSAAYNDFMSIISKSGFAFRVTLLDAYMQGVNTPREVSAGIERLERQPQLDVIVVVRGGGARTDLLYFDDLTLCTAIAQCRLPVITGIGHEIDLSVADMVASRHFVTPTDAARFLVGELEAAMRRVEEAGAQMAQAAGSGLREAEARMMLQAGRLVRLAQAHTRQEGARLGALGFALHSSTQRGLNQQTSRVLRTGDALRTRATQVLVEAQRRLPPMKDVLQGGARMAMTGARERLVHLEGLLALLDPAGTLKRGFSLTLNARGRVLTDAGEVNTGERITSLLAFGRVLSRVEEKERG